MILFILSQLSLSYDKKIKKIEMNEVVDFRMTGSLQKTPPSCMHGRQI